MLKGMHTSWRRPELLGGRAGKLAEVDGAAAVAAAEAGAAERLVAMLRPRGPDEPVRSLPSLRVLASAACLHRLWMPRLPFQMPFRAADIATPLTSFLHPQPTFISQVQHRAEVWLSSSVANPLFVGRRIDTLGARQAAAEGFSPAVRAGALRCGLRAALKLAAEPHLRAALQRAGAREVLQVHHRSSARTSGAAYLL